MTPTQYALAIKRLGLDQIGAAAFLGVSPRTGRNYISGDAEIPLSSERLLELMLEKDVTPDHFGFTDSNKSARLEARSQRKARRRQSRRQSTTRAARKNPFAPGAA